MPDIHFRPTDLIHAAGATYAFEFALADGAVFRDVSTQQMLYFDWDRLKEILSNNR